MDTENRYQTVSTRTRETLSSILQAPFAGKVSQILPQVDDLAYRLGKVIPTKGVFSVILSGIYRLSARKLSSQTLKRERNPAREGIERIVDAFIYGAFFAIPAAVIWVYQNAYQLLGKVPEDAFPEGTWQFYVEYALREDTARHCNETHGFDTLFKQHQIDLNAVDRYTALTMAAIHCLHEYDALLRNEWRERVYTSILTELTRHLPAAGRFAELYREWELQRPYGRSSDAGTTETYTQYRRAKFDHFLRQAMQGLHDDLRRQWVQRVWQAREQDLPAYQEQMSILAYLKPEPYGEIRQPIPLSEAHVGVIYQGRYYLIPACAPGTARPANVHHVRSQIAALLTHSPDAPPAQLVALARLQRATWGGLQARLNGMLLGNLARLRTAPILINFDQRPSHLPLAKIRQAERGVGDHAMTIFDTGRTFIFDQSHIFFDGTWGAALAEILTNEAASWATYVHSLPPCPVSLTRDEHSPSALRLRLHPSDWALIEKKPQVTAEASAETKRVNIKAIMLLRDLFKQRGDLQKLTVNDILVLYRAIHAAQYEPDPTLTAALEARTRDRATRTAAAAALDAINRDTGTNPAILIPVDASKRDPRARLHPMSFSVPLEALDLLNLHRRTSQALYHYHHSGTNYEMFNTLQRRYLMALSTLGELFSQAKGVAAAGESASVGTIKLLAHLPGGVQHMLDQIPHRFDVLNDIIKGSEVLSNVGAVVPSSTLTRFLTAKDDNEQKRLAWGVMTDSEKVMYITLRDFRPHVALLVATGYQDLANRIAQDYLDAYAHGLNEFIRNLLQITLASWETRQLAIAESEHG